MVEGTRMTGVRRWAAGVLSAAVALACAAPVAAVEVRRGDPGKQTDLVVFHDDGTWTGSPNARQPRPALSLAKLYLGYWILQHGTAEEKGKVLRMVRASSDVVAVELDSAHPEAINEVAEEFGLRSTRSDGYWGQSVTSPYDLAMFVSEIRDDPVAEPIMRGMANHAPFAEDGFKQDFGTDQMAGVIGSKFGWSDDLEGTFGSVSFGADWVIAAMSYGDVDEHTDDVHKWIDQESDAHGLSNGADKLLLWLTDRQDAVTLPRLER